MPHVFHVLAILMSFMSNCPIKYSNISAFRRVSMNKHRFQLFKYINCTSIWHISGVTKKKSKYLFWTRKGPRPISPKVFLTPTYFWQNFVFYPIFIIWTHIRTVYRYMCRYTVLSVHNFYRCNVLVYSQLIQTGHTSTLGHCTLLNIDPCTDVLTIHNLYTHTHTHSYTAVQLDATYAHLWYTH